MTQSTQMLIGFLVYAVIAVIGCGWAVKRRKITRIEFIVCAVIVVILGAILYPIYSFQHYREAASWQRKHSYIHQVRE
jgi:NADH:ubiquinone oxidoreductase subunit 3 (subunit A)